MPKILKIIYKKFGFYIRGSISLGLLFYIFSKLDLALVADLLQELNPSLLLLSLLLANSSILLSAMKWQKILENLDEIIPLRHLTSLYYRGTFLNNFFPSNIGGDGYKFLILSKEIKSKEKALLSILLDRISGFIILLIFCSISFLLFFKEFSFVIKEFIEAQRIFLAITVLVGVCSLLGSIFYIKKYKFSRNYLLELNRATSPSIFFLSTGFYLLTIFNNYVISLAYGININPIYYLIFMPIILLALFLPLSFNGIGIRETSFIYFFGLISVSPENAFVLAFTPYLLLLITGAFGGLLFLLQPSKGLTI